MSKPQNLSVCEITAINEAMRSITRGDCKSVQVNDRTKVYKIPSNNPDKYVIRVDIKVEENA